MALRGGRAILAARGDPLRRALQAPGDQRGQHLLRERAALGAEAAADVFRDHTHRFLLQTQRPRDRFPDAEDVLGRGPDLQAAALRVGGDGHRTRLHGRAGDAGGRQADLRGHAVTAEGGAYVSVAHLLAPRDVAVHVRVDGGRALCRGGDDVSDTRKRIQLGVHLLGRVLRLVGGLGHDQRVRLADVVDLLAVEDRPRLLDHVLGSPIAQAARDLLKIRGRPHLEHTRHRPGGCRIDGDDAGVGQRGAAEGDVDEAIELDVSGEATAACDQSLILDAAHAPADVRSHRS